MRIYVSFEPPFAEWASKKRRELEVAEPSLAALEVAILDAEPLLRTALMNLGDKFCFVYSIDGYRIDPGYTLKDGDRVQVFSPLLAG